MMSLWSKNHGLLNHYCLFPIPPHDLHAPHAGVVFTILAATGTFPASTDVMKARNTYALTIAKYILYALSGAGAYLAAKSARDSLRKGRPTTVAKGILELSAAGVLASAVMTVVSMVISSQGSHATPVWVYIIQVVVGVTKQSVDSGISWCQYRFDSVCQLGYANMHDSVVASSYWVLTNAVCATVA
jgi:hypothetical protein